MRMKYFALCAAAVLLAQPASSQQVDRGGRPILEVASQLKNGEYVWAPELAADGPMLVVVNLATQRLIAFRNGVPIGASTVSSGKDGYETPTGVFTILQKAKEHYSKTYNNAPMPNMQRLTWKGIALHAGNLPGYPASHGCVRLPIKFSGLLFGATNLGMTVVITSLPVTPQASTPPALASAAASSTPVPLSRAAYQWHAARAGKGIVSVVVSTSDNRAIVLQDGVEIGSAPVRYSGQLTTPIAYVLRSREAGPEQWLKLYYSGSGGSMDAPPEDASKFDAPTTFRQQLMTLLRPGSIIIVTPQPLKAGSPGKSQTVFEDDDSTR